MNVVKIIDEVFLGYLDLPVQIIKIPSIYRSQVWGWNGAFSKALASK